MGDFQNLVIDELKKLNEKIQKLEEKKDQSRTGEEMEEDQAEDSNDEQDSAPSWGDILKATAVEATQEGALNLCQVLSLPPPLDQLRASEKSMPFYTKVPQTPPARKNRVDANLCNAQKKMECAMHMLVHHLETNDKEAIGVGAAFVRSAWEDLQQQRRFLMAGKQSFKLEHRADDTRPKLLSKEEEQKIGRGRNPKPRARSFWGEASSSSHAFSSNEQQHRRRTPTPRAKGKGKGGRGKGL